MPIRHGHPLRRLARGTTISIMIRGYISYWSVQQQKGTIPLPSGAAPKVLVSAGLLGGHQATSYPRVLDKTDLPQVDVNMQPVIRDDRVITSHGSGTAMDFALELIEALAGRATRNEVGQSLYSDFCFQQNRPVIQSDQSPKLVPTCRAALTQE
ncbi:DJ-1/PfpI family protein [Candidatus Vondammii sp. HM_W22]|uniref:DJ-1/PfpI family protein n=1 Tax=Candidatus Vondammii sp. HM_W22 TaxID=2687299 RepID=UPI002A4E1D8F|nr:DJ-1/PfpI family protein [Candidatus Vondammii sp. HM_W22]